MAGDSSARVQKLKAACDEAYLKYPHSCSHAVWVVLKQYIPDQPYLDANGLIHRLAGSSKWQEVQLFDLSRLASEGDLIVGGLATASHGHVIVVYPGPPKHDGGFICTNSKGRRFVAPSTGLYALAMSTSMGSSWPGTKSKGDKTVADPWSAGDFKKVRFWKYIGY